MAHGGESGSVLIEALVALLILAALSGLWFATAGNAAQREHRVSAHMLAVLVATSQLAAVGVTDAVTPGTVTGQDAGFDWEIAITPEAGSGRLARVAVTVRNHDGKTLAVLSTLRLLT